MRIDIYLIKGYEKEETSATLIHTSETINDAINFVNDWLADKDYTESSANIINEILELETNEAHIIRDSAEFKLVQYGGNGPSGWGGLKINLIRVEPEENEIEENEETP